MALTEQIKVSKNTKKILDKVKKKYSFITTYDAAISYVLTLAEKQVIKEKELSK